MLGSYVGKIVDAAKPSLLHLVDLQGARDGRFRDELVSMVRIAAPETPLQVSGGVRSVAHARTLIAAGAARVIIGTAAFATPSALQEFVDALGERLVIALDVRDGRVAANGWVASSGLDINDACDHCEAAGVVRVHATAIARDGTMTGPDLALYEQLSRRSFSVIAAGGIRDANDVAQLERVGCEAAVMGTAYAYELGVL